MEQKKESFQAREQHGLSLGPWNGPELFERRPEGLGKVQESLGFVIGSLGS